MGKASFYLLAAFGVSAALYFGVEAIKDAGESRVVARVEAEKAAAIEEATRHAAALQADLARRAAESEALAAAKTAELEAMRNELAQTGGNPVVFGEPWRCWLRGGKCPGSGASR